MAVDYADGYHAPNGFCFAIYPVWYGAGKTTDNNGNTAIDNYDFNTTLVYLRPVYYINDFVFDVVVPIGQTSTGYSDQHDDGIGDILIDLGYFLPIKCADVLFDMHFKIPTGYDKDSDVNFGDGQFDVRPSIFINKYIGKFCIDAAIKYKFRFENKHIALDLGDEVSLEALVTYKIFKDIRLGPSISYRQGFDKKVQGKKIKNSGPMQLSVGGQLIYQITPKIQVLVAALADTMSKNTIKGVSVYGRIVMSFN